MNPSPRRRLTDRTIGRLVVLAVVSVAVGLAVPRDTTPQAPAWANVIGAVLVVFGLYGLFELAAWGVSSLLALTPLGADRGEERFEPPGERSDTVERRTGSFRAREAFILFGGYVAAQLVVWIPIGVLAVGDDGQVDSERLASLAAPGLLLSLLGACAAVVLIFRRQERRCSIEMEEPNAADDLRQAIGLRPASAGDVGRAAAVGALLGVAMVLLSAQVPVRDDADPSILARAAQTSGLLQYAWVIAVVILAPPLEEFLFRGAMYEGFRRSWGPQAAGAAVTVLFVAMHLPETWQYWPALFGITAGAVAMLIARLRTASLWPPVALHFGYNATLAGVVLAATAVG